MRLTHATVSTIWLLASGIAYGGCATAGRSDFHDVTPRQTMLRVANHNWLDAKIYLVDGASRMRVGTVMGMASQEVIALPSAHMRAGGTVLMVELIGSSARYVSPQLIVDAGQVIELEIQNNLALTHVSVW